MKTKHCLIFMPVFTVLCAALRTLQHLFVIDGDGYFLANNIIELILRYSVYALFVICTVFSLIAYFCGKKEAPNAKTVFGGKLMGFLFIIIALCGMMFGGLLLSSPLSKVPQLLCYLISLFAVCGSVMFAVVGIRILSKSEQKTVSVFGIFAPLCAVCVGIGAFYRSFESAHKSETIIFMLTLCALALFINSLCLVHGGAAVSSRRVVASAFLYPPFAASAIVSAVMTKSFSVFDILQLFVFFAFIVISFVVLVRMSFIKEPEQIKTDDDIIEKLNVYLNEIPDENVRGENE